MMRACIQYFKRILPMLLVHHPSLYLCLLIQGSLKLKTGLTLPESWAMPEWPPNGSLGSNTGSFLMGLSPGMGLGKFGTSPYGKSLDMVDMCTQLMDGGGGGFGLIQHASACCKTMASRCICTMPVRCAILQLLIL